MARMANSLEDPVVLACTTIRGLVTSLRDKGWIVNVTFDVKQGHEQHNFRWDESWREKEPREEL